MADGRELPDEARTRRTTGDPPTVIRPGGGIGPFPGETSTPVAGRHPTDSPATPVGKYDGPGTGGTQGIQSAPGSGERPAAPASSDTTVLFGKYLVQRKLGEGAMGEVWLVRHRELGVERALKLINLARFSDPEMRARARREARAMALFSHPNAVTVHDANADGDLAYIEMEYIRGRSLNKVFRPGTPMPVAWVAEMVQQLCAALEVAHSHGIVHRDLKPSNMMLVGDEPQEHEHLKILDFGIAKILHAEDQGGDDLKTWSGAIIGTPAYMSPEQINTESGQLDGRSDLYTVGIILFEMLAGRRPFTSASFRLTFDHLHTVPPSFSEVNPNNEVPEEIELLVRRCLEKDPKNRPRSARELADEFRRLTTPPEPVVQPAGLSRRRALVFGGLLTALIAAATVAALRPPGPARRPFAIRASKGELVLKAGDEARLTIVAEGDAPGGKPTIKPVDVPKWLEVTKESSSATPGLDEFRVAVGFDAPLGPFPLTFRGQAGNQQRATKVALKIEAAEFTLPPGFSPAPGSRPVRDNGKLYHSRIIPERGGTQAEFLFIKKNHSGEPDSFYIMKDKVSNGLYALFDRSKLDAAREALKKPYRDDPERDAERREALKQVERLPSLNVSTSEVYRFAEWLGQNKARINLPTIVQWDKAAGYYDENRQGMGPFRPDWMPGSKAIALRRFFPAPVGSSDDDVSPYGCQDMAGNGMEWTRNTGSVGIVLPLPPKDGTLVRLRGADYGNEQPFSYAMIDDREIRGAAVADPTNPDSTIGFRLVIDEL